MPPAVEQALHMQPLIIEAAINGATSPQRNPHVPRTPAEITRDALACLDAGAAIVHSHVDGWSLRGGDAVRRYLEGWQPVWQARPEALLYGTLASGPGFEERFGHFRALAEHGMQMGAFDPGSVNLATHGDDGLPGSKQFVYSTTFADVAALVRLHDECRLGPSIAIYEPGWLRVTLAYWRAGRLPRGAFIKFYFGGPHNPIDGRKSPITFGLPPTATALAAYLEMMDDCPLPWAACVLGGDITALGMTELAIARGGHVRVGIEDWAGEGSARNSELVAQVVSLARAMGREVADCHTAARILDLPRVAVRS